MRKRVLLVFAACALITGVAVAVAVSQLPSYEELLRRDNVVSPEAIEQGRTLAGLGIDPAAFEVIAPTYLWRFRKTGQFRRRPA